MEDSRRYIVFREPGNKKNTTEYIIEPQAYLIGGSLELEWEYTIHPENASRMNKETAELFLSWLGISTSPTQKCSIVRVE